MFDTFKKLRRAVREARQYNPEIAYLNAATSRTDLERRQREIDSGRFRAGSSF